MYLNKLTFGYADIIVRGDNIVRDVNGGGKGKNNNVGQKEVSADPNRSSTKTAAGEVLLLAALRVYMPRKLSPSTDTSLIVSARRDTDKSTRK